MNKKKDYYLVTIEGTVPISVSYRVYSFDEEDAYNIVNSSPWNAQIQGQPKLNLLKIKKSKVSVKNLLTGVINWVKKF